MTGAATVLEEARRVHLAAGALDYTLRRSRRARRLRVTIDPTRGVVVTIPLRGAVRPVETFLREREAWLRRHLQTQAQRRAQAALHRPFGPEGRIAYRGESHRVRLESADAAARRSRVLRVGGDDVDELVLVEASAAFFSGGLSFFSPALESLVSLACSFFRPPRP